ncbi:hypothetical protein SOM12_18940 [Flavobacterium sp. CFBP9031]|jgi:hypothetical protein|uniref:hypothetical protein n=1 Tax=unclassified Flavobacterium TaxID=196869 RepID=UPI002A6ABDDA|nr:hypothetical protein [Flavobacterium sp. CFBP9031]MDY0989515.1 hypothetical protein [Flavobacterium sp. CFBP9031]
MIEQLLKKTNDKKFYNDCDLKLESYRFQTSDHTLEMIFSINQNSYDIPIEYEEWKITCLKTEKFDGFFWSLTLPYVKMKILEHHPLLLIFHENIIECEIQGKPLNVNEFIGEISNILEKETGNWITVNEYLWNNEEFYQKYSKRAITIPKSLGNSIMQVCKKHDMDFQIKNEVIGEKKGYKDKSNVKILIFGNEDVSPNDFNLCQPYIIAEEFIAERIK